MEDKPMTGEEVLQQILGALNGNGMQQAANGVYELCAYVDSMTHKVEDMTDEIVRLREDIRKMQDNTFSNRLKKSLSEAADRLEKRCEEIKQQIFEVKESIKSKAGEIMADFKMRGKAALNRVSEFIGLKDKLVGIRNKVKEGIADTNRTIAKIDSFGKGMREAGQKVANTFRTFADKEEVDYSEKEKKFSKTEVAKKPWEWQKKVYQNLELHLDAAIDKVDNLAKDVKLQRMEKKWDELYEQTHQESKETAQPQALSLVSEPEYEYGAEAFEAYMKENESELVDKTNMNAVQKNDKIR